MSYWPEKSQFDILLKFRTLQIEKSDLEYKLMWLKYEEDKSMREALILP